MPPRSVLAITLCAFGLSGLTCASRDYVGLLDALDCPLMPDDSYWHADVSALPVHPQSDAWVASIGAGAPVHPEFGAALDFGGLQGPPIGIPYVSVRWSQPMVPVSFDFPDESDPGPYPIPPDAPVEGGSDFGGGDRRLLVVDRAECMLYELHLASREDGDAWSAARGAMFPLDSNELRPDGQGSADAAGLPILPGLVRWEEAMLGRVGHAIRFTAPATQGAHVWPARSHASSDPDPALPPMGAWFRLKADVDPADFSPMVRPIVEALQRHGVILADEGPAWHLSGVPSQHWDNDVLQELRTLTGADFEAVDVSSLMVSPDSGQVVEPIVR